jgi:hypothetical protein
MKLQPDGSSVRGTPLDCVSLGSLASVAGGAPFHCDQRLVLFLHSALPAAIAWLQRLLDSTPVSYDAICKVDMAFAPT